ncbi:MAG: anaerobic ribonucleoside-triphosphate reductase activating protein [Desulfovibrionaceae bacterium]
MGHSPQGDPLYTLRVNGMVEESIADGPGLRFVVFTQGCPHHCGGCHNPDTHAMDGGFLLDTRDILRQFRENPLLAGITFSGGEPFMQAAPLGELAVRVRALGKHVLVYTGYVYERLQERSVQEPAIAKLLAQTNTLIDGPYVAKLRSLELLYRGSSNQRILHLHE